MVVNWPRERDETTVHIAPDAARALCDVDPDQLGLTIRAADVAAPDIWPDCSRRLLATSIAAEHALASAVRDRGFAALELVNVTARMLARMVPDDVHADLLVYARACLDRGDPRDARASIQQWPQSMRKLGVFAGSVRPE